MKTDRVSILKRNGKWLVSRKCSTSIFETFPYYNLAQLLVWYRVDPTWHKTIKKQNVPIFCVHWCTDPSTRGPNHWDIYIYIYSHPIVHSVKIVHGRTYTYTNAHTHTCIRRHTCIYVYTNGHIYIQIDSCTFCLITLCTYWIAVYY